MTVRRQWIVALFAVSVLAVPAPVHAASATRYGVITSTQGSEPDTAANFIRLFERQRAVHQVPLGIRLFSPALLPLPGDGTMAGTVLTWAATTHPEELITVSHKTRADARLGTLLDWVREHGLRVSIIYFHEVQGSLDRRAEPAVYRATYRAYRALIAAHPARSRVILEKNMNWYAEYHRRSTPGNGAWRSYVEAGDPADLVSWDTYVFPGMPTSQGRYATPDEFFRYARDVWREFRLPWAVGEIGSTVQDGTGSERDWDRDGAKFTRWVREITAAAAGPATIGAAYQGMPAALFMKWWEALDAEDHELGVSQVPAAARAYRTLVRG